ncbi:MAG: hypothetical protein HC915_07540 [Anaerolineae bacterium]|nr:hypothetical protein [Anaerolineae bacterium]
MSRYRERDARRHIIRAKPAVPCLVLWAFGLAGLAALAALGVAFAPTLLDLVRGTQYATDNRTWLTASWTDRERTTEEFEALEAILSDNGISAVYVQTNRWHGQTGEFIELPQAAAFVERWRALNQEITLYSWIVLAPERLTDETARQQIVQFAGRAVREMGYQGIHLQALSVPDSSEDYITLLRDLRTALAPTSRLSVTVPPRSPAAGPGCAR